MSTTPRPSLTPVIYLRGAGVRQPAWRRIERAMWAQGWDTTHVRTEAWHLARGGVPVAILDFTSTHGSGLTRETITVGKVRAKYAETLEWCQVEDLLPTAERVRLTRERADWLRHPIHRTVTEMELPLTSGGEIPRPYRRDTDGRQILDEHAMARAVAKALGIPAAAADETDPIEWVHTAMHRREDQAGARLMLQLARSHERSVRATDDEDVLADASIAVRLAREALEDALDRESRDLRRIGQTARRLGITPGVFDTTLDGYLSGGEEPTEFWCLSMAAVRTAIEARQADA
jgi:hypothetical protein